VKIGKCTKVSTTHAYMNIKQENHQVVNQDAKPEG